MVESARKLDNRYVGNVFQIFGNPTLHQYYSETLSEVCSSLQSS